MTPVAASPPPVAFPPMPADHALLQRILEQEHVARALPAPDWTGYLVELARAGIEALPDVVAPARDAITGLGLSMEMIATVLVGLIVLVVTVLAAIAVRRRLRRRRPDSRPRDATAANTRDEVPRNRDVWRALLEEHLRAGRLAEALEAAWWWLAASISRGPVDPAWTSRELLVRSGRPDLAEWAASLDRLTYGPRRPGADDVRGVVHALESAL